MSQYCLVKEDYKRQIKLKLWERKKWLSVI